jgi:hypothetical protein
MVKTIEISKSEARNLVIQSQGLDKSQNTLAALKQLGYLQIDTLSVTQRAHHHVLYSRNPAYKKDELHQLVKEKKVFEYWSHAAAFLPIEHYRYSLIKKQKFLNGKSHWFKKDKQWMKYVLDRISTEGPLQSKDFKTDTNKNPDWYEWKPAKIALQQLFMEGQLMIKKRVNFQKVYDLSHRVLPADIVSSMPTQKEYFKHLIDTTIAAQGLAKTEEIGYLRKGIKKDLQLSLDELVEDKKIIQIKVDGELYYSQAKSINKITEITKPTIHIINPFDNILIQRKRLKNLFDFDYQIECYVPEAKRKYGYYVLPLLYGNQFIGRLDAKADRKTRIFTVKNIWFENHFKPTSEFKKEMKLKLIDFAQFCGCNKVIMLK